MRLAFALGRTPRELFESTNEDELLELITFSQIEFVGDERRDWAFARLIATIRNLMPGRGEAVTADRFMPFWDQAAIKRRDEARLAAKVRHGLRAAARSTSKPRSEDGISG